MRLLVLTGAGGSGKTRLALEAARRSAPSFANGAAFVGLASLRDPGLLATAISNALGIEQLAGEPLETIAAALRPAEMLLLLDNLEHLREATPVLVELVSRAPRLTLLVTSRVVLHLSGEHVYPVGPLAQEAALALFLERAREADARFDPHTSAERAIRRICERLDGLPLAIELAAGRIRTRTPAELLDRLEQRLPLLIGGPRDLPARQQTLRATLEWSVDLLDEGEQRDLARLSVFAGGCTLETGEAVCETTLERLSALVDQNLLVRAVDAHGSRYSMLETIREFASELLEASGEAEQVRRRHAKHALLVAESLGLSVDALGSGVQQRFDLALVEQDNMRAVLDWALEVDPELGLRLALALEQFWVSSNPREGMDRFEAFLVRAPELPLELRARAIRDLGGSTEVTGEWERAAEHYGRSLELFEKLGDELGIIRLKHRLAGILVYRRDFVNARKLIAETLERAMTGGFRYEESDLLHVLSVLEFYAGNVEAASDLQRQSLDLSREFGRWAWGETIKLSNLARFENRLGHADAAEAYAREALEFSREVGSRISTVFSLASLAVAAKARGADERAGRLWGAIEAEEERLFLGRWAARRDEFASEVLLPACAEFDRGLDAGRRLTLEEATVFALKGGGV